MGKKGSGENIRVVIRCRNLLQGELERGDKAAVRMDLATSQVVVQHAIGDPETHAFDAVYNNTYTQRDIFLQEVQPLVEAVLQGYNATVFAYGQSGSGKTHTMTGKLEDPALWGMMPQVVDHLFKEVRKLSSNTKSFKIRVSYIELYNGKSRDLLSAKQTNLEIKQNASKNFFVKGAELPEVTNFDECIRYFNAGTDRRQTASTDLNEQSSRSHSLFQLQVEQSDFEHDPSSPIVLTSKINVVDLAGSEKLSKTNATGDTAKEGCNINLSLSALATVIDTIVKGAAHIPYRGSPLTMLLKDSLGGNAKTVMFANIGPSDKNISETISTLRFALRAKQIENKPIKNLDPKDARIQELLEKIEELQRRCGNVNLNEEENLKQRIEELEIENADLRGAQGKDTIELEEINKSKQAQIEQLIEAVKERDREVQNCQERLALADSNRKNDQEHQNELRSVASNFIKRICTDQQIRDIRARMPNDGSYNMTEEGWDLKEIQFYLEGFLGLYETWRHQAFTQDDVAKQVAKATQDMQEQYQRQMIEVNRVNEELQRQKQEELQKRTADGESQSQLRVELSALKDENVKLREKIERDQEKMKAKLAKNKEDAKAISDELENLKSQLAASERDNEKLKKLLEDSGNRATIGGAPGSPSRSGGTDADRSALLAQLEQTESQKKALESWRNDTIITLRRNGFSLKDSSFIPGGVPPPPPPPSGGGDGAHNEAFIIHPSGNADEEPVDGDMLGQLQQQIRVQHRLHELRHLQQRKLDDMVRKFELLKTGQVTPNSAEGEGTISEEALAARVAVATAAKDEELANLRAETEQKMDKLVKKLNKEATKSKELESTLAEEKAAWEEERSELTSQTEELQKFNQQLSVEVENLRNQMNNAKFDAEGAERTLQVEISHLKNECAKLLATLESYKTKASEYEELQTEHQRLVQQNNRTEQSLKEKIATLDNNRQMIKWSNSLLEQEKKKVQEAEDQRKAQEQQFREMEEHWRSQLIENANKLVAVNNKRLEEQAAQYQQLLAEEQEKQKAVREKLKKAKSATQKAAQRYDEMVLENESLLVKFEDLKVTSMKIFLEKQEAQRDLDAFRPTSHGFGNNNNRRF